MMMKTLFFCLVAVCVLSVPVASDDAPCCRNCTAPLAKYYSIVSVPHSRCGESCIHPEDEWKYKIFEWHLKRANVTKVCESFGFPVYTGTETHGKEVDLPVTVDFYDKTQRSALPSSQ